MKSIYNYINENLLTESVVSTFSKATIKAIYDNILDAEIEFDIKNYKITDCRFVTKYDYVYFEYNFTGPDGKFKNNQLIHIRPNRLEIGDFELSNKSTIDCRCELVSITYNKRTKKTCLEYKASGLTIKGSFYIYGTIKLYVPGDVMNAKDSYNVDCKAYDKFMEKFIHTKTPYVNIDVRDILSWNSEMRNNELYIDIHLDTGKGYSETFRKVNYDFIWRTSYYVCNRELYDRNNNDQIVHKFIIGLTEFIKNKTELPEKVHITTYQELE